MKTKWKQSAFVFSHVFPTKFAPAPENKDVFERPGLHFPQKFKQISRPHSSHSHSLVPAHCIYRFNSRAAGCDDAVGERWRWRSRCRCRHCLCVKKTTTRHQSTHTLALAFVAIPLRLLFFGTLLLVIVVVRIIIIFIIIIIFSSSLSSALGVLTF